jgi:hypothetical protein
MRDLRIGDLFLVEPEEWDAGGMFVVQDVTWDGAYAIVKLMTFDGPSLVFEDYSTLLEDKLEERAVLVSRRPSAGVNYAVE